MTENDRITLRLGLVEDHWALGEDAEALRCLEKAMDEAPDHPEIAAQLRLLRASAESDHHPVQVRERLDELAVRVFGPEEGEDPAAPEEVESPEDVAEDELDEQDLPPLATSTVAELLAEQGLHDKARAVAAEVLERSPADERARTLLRRLAHRPEPDETGMDRGNEPIDTLAVQIERLERWLTHVRQARNERGSRA